MATQDPWTDDDTANGGRNGTEPEAEPLQRKPAEQFELEVSPTAINQERCGIACFTPQCLQRFATKQAFMIVFSLLAIIQAMTWSYFTATITTLEKRFKISSQTAGIVMTGNELSQVLFAIIISYYGSRGHRPRWIAVGVLFSALSCFVLASPHLFYGPGADAYYLTEEYVQENSHTSFLTKNSSMVPSIKQNRVQLCEPSAGQPIEFCGSGETSIVPLVLIFLSQFVAGIGVLLFYSLGGPYLDDNIEKTQSPMLFGVTMSLRLIGPILGFLMASACLKVFISPGLHPIISTDDPRWMGAWWLGWVILGSMMLLTTVFIAMFPKELPEATARREKNRRAVVVTPRRRSSHGVLSLPDTPADLAKVGSQIILPPENSADSPLPKLSDLGSALKALLKNKVNLFNNLSSVFYLFAAIGYWTYMPKYMETIFMQTAVSASAISGTVSIAFQACGLLLSGALISKFQPSARKLAAWNVCLGLILVIAKIIFTQVGCNPGQIAHSHGFGSIETNQNEGQGQQPWNLTTTCNTQCNCKVNKMLPVCYKEKNQVFYSACHAGCSTFENNTGSDCGCLDPGATVTLGNCSEGCFTIFLTFLIINAVIKFLDSSGRIGNMLVSYRCVDPKEKSLAIGLGIFLISIFSMLPAPIFFGAIFDNTCLVWGEKCGGRGNCWLYDGETLRYAFNLSAAAFTLIGTIFDGLVWYYVKDLDLYDEDKNVQNRLEKKLGESSPVDIPQEKE